MTIPRRFSCRHYPTSTHALAALRDWFEDIHADQVRQLETDLLLACEEDDLDIDALDALLDAERGLRCTATRRHR